MRANDQRGDGGMLRNDLAGTTTALIEDDPLLDRADAVAVAALELRGDIAAYAAYAAGPSSWQPPYGGPGSASSGS